MHKKLFRLNILALLALLSILLVGCAPTTAYENVEEPVIEESIEISTDNSSRFSAEFIQIPEFGYSPTTYTSQDPDYHHFQYCYIITDHETGKQYLYLYHTAGGVGTGESTLIEIGTATETTS